MQTRLTAKTHQNSERYYPGGIDRQESAGLRGRVPALAGADGGIVSAGKGQTEWRVVQRRGPEDGQIVALGYLNDFGSARPSVEKYSASFCRNRRACVRTMLSSLEL